MINILENVVMPEDRVLDELLVCDSSHYAAVIVNRKLENLLLYPEVDVVMEESFGAKVLVYEHFSRADELIHGHEGNLDWDQSDDSLEESWVLGLLHLDHGLAILVQELPIVQVEHRCHVV